jgi:type 1 glutamine amidotransferase
MKFPVLILALLASIPAFLLAAPAGEATKKVLVVSVTTGFRHSSIPVAEKVLAQLAAESGRFSVDFVRQPAGMTGAPGRPRPGPKGEADAGFQAALRKFEADQKAYTEVWLPKAAAELGRLSPAKLAAYDAVLFLSTTGDLPLPDKQGFLDWIAAGKAFVGVHAATDTFHGFPPFIAMIGGEFKTHGPQVAVDCLNQDPAHAACRPLPKVWSVFDEIYQFKNFERSKVHGLLTLDRHPNDKTPGDYPVAWSKPFGRGRVFYTSLGHREDMWDPAFTDKAGRKNSPENARLFQQHLLGGILWALGLAPGSAQP